MEKYIGDLELDNGDVIAVVKKNGYLIAGGMTNSGIFEDYKMKYDEDESMDVNLQNFVEYIDSHMRHDSKMPKNMPKHKHSRHKAIERGAIKGSKRDSYTSLTNVKDFLENAVDMLTDESDGTMYVELTDDLYAVCAFFDGDIKVKIAYNNDDLQSDYDYDWYCPYDKETGDVICVETTFDGHNIDSTASYLLKEAKSIQEEIDNGTITIGDSKKFKDSKRANKKSNYAVKTSALKKIHSRDSVRRHARDSKRKTYSIKRR